MSVMMMGVVAYTAVAGLGALLGLVLMWGTYQDARVRRRSGQNGVIAALIRKRAVRYVCIGGALFLLLCAGVNTLWPRISALTVVFLLAQPALLGGYMLYDYASDLHIMGELHRLEHRAKAGAKGGKIDID